MPKRVEECSKVLSFAQKEGVAVVPRGAGTGTTGGAVPIGDAIILSTEHMNNIIDIDVKNGVAVVEPGVINGHLQKILKDFGLFYPPDPASMAFCTLGGNVAENAGGPRGIKYGVTRDYVLGLEAVLPNGKVIKTGVKTYKGVVGYDLTSLIVGSEGTLGVITKIFLKIIPLPEKIITLSATFSSIEDAAKAVVALTSSKITPSTLEFMDSNAILAVSNYKKIELPKECEALLLIEVDGLEDAVKREADIVASICSRFGGSIKRAETLKEREKLWEARRSISPALYTIRPYKINEDIVVPRGMLPNMLREIKRLSEVYRVMIVNFGHAGDGNIHVNIMTNIEDEDEYMRAKAVVPELFSAALKLGGTISGEHGVGMTKRPFIKMEIEEDALNMMKLLKKSFDPVGIMNPNKIFP
ncbi:MAG: FAD-binding protein [Nitrospirae bacterium]|nr:MAG: FAD-binding protein [Nitrospirota bacterium]